MPTSTDLVTDLPADFEVALQGVDTRLKALQPGTTLGDLAYSSATANTNTRLPIGTNGQVLAVSSGVPTWTTTADVTPLTTKGDLFTFTTVDARLGVGNNGESLVADSSTSTGLRYQGTIAAGKNFLINGGFDIWQRSTSATLVTVGSYIAPDRMACTSDSGGNGTASQVTSSLPTGFRYGLKLQRTAANTSVGIISVAQFLETNNSIPLAGQTVTVSFWAKAGANFSAGSSALLVRGFTGTGTDQAGGFGTWTGYAEPISSNPIITTSWVRYSVTGTLASSATQFGLRIGYTPAGTAGADDSLQITGMQVEIGSVATNFLRTGGNIQGELAACQRYYFRTGVGSGSTTPNIYEPIGYGSFSSTTNFSGQVQFPVTMRVRTGAVEFSNVAINDTAAVIAVTAVTVNADGINATNINLTVASGGTAFRFGRIVNNNNSAGYLAWSAEL